MIHHHYLGPRMGLYLWKLELSVVWIHLFDLFSGGCSQNLNDLHQLVYSTVSRKDRLTQHQLCNTKLVRARSYKIRGLTSKDTTRGPNINVGGVVGGPKYQLRSSGRQKYYFCVKYVYRIFLNSLDIIDINHCQSSVTWSAVHDIYLMNVSHKWLQDITMMTSTNL